MLKLSSTTKFNKDLKLCKKRNYDLDLLYDVVNILRIPAELPLKNKDHRLKGEYNDRRECHIAPDWLLIYRVKDDELVLDRTGTHSDLFDE
ncbi:MAG: type II toxin-antitoxin system YafQ family toxin [Lachnospiraceae bacterium]|nr:type II toxin-antitoxin system YafQ family toxin [Lachnospiraceae bacterium]